MPMWQVLVDSYTCVIVFSIGLIIYLNILHGTQLNPLFITIDMYGFKHIINRERDSDF